MMVFQSPRGSLWVYDVYTHTEGERASFLTHRRERQLLALRVRKMQTQHPEGPGKSRLRAGTWLRPVRNQLIVFHRTEGWFVRAGATGHHTN